MQKQIGFKLNTNNNFYINNNTWVSLKYYSFYFDLKLKKIKMRYIF